MTGLPGFSSWTNHNWSTIMELNLQSASDSHAMNQMLEKVPNLERLILQGCRLSLETIFLAKHLPCLKYFEFGGDVRLEDSYPHISHTPMTSLKEIVFRLEEYGIKYCNCANSRELLLSLILCGGAPSLRSLEFRGNGVFDWTTYTRKKRSHVNKAVRTLILHDERTGFDVSTAPKIKAMFPNLKFLKLRECTAAARKKLAKRYPHLIITVEPI
ncbi:hypothetical protein GQ42DRAFT_155211 [Ramicandelaber brevisporus]|nr:hypothetical protein GQ42DRAFT_155211 [Ramicandelaber brevisporus]